MRYVVLGPLAVEDAAGAQYQVRRGRARTLLHLLMVHRGAFVSVETIADRLWGENQPANAANAVHQIVSYLRRALGPGKDDLLTSVAGYQLDVPDDDIDACRFLALMQESGALLASESSLDGARQVLAVTGRAARLWRGEPYMESGDQEWIAADVARLKEAYLEVQENRLEAMLRLGRHREVVLEAQSLASAYPFREHFHAQVALALYRSDRQSEALESLRAVRGLLDRELGLEPGASLQQLEQAILRQDPAMAWTPPGGLDEVEQVAAASAPPPSSDVSSRQGELPFPTPPRSVLPPPPQVLVGREVDLDRLGPDLAAPGTRLTLTGLPGVGKTALARRLAHDAAQAGNAVWWVDLASTGDDLLVGAKVIAQVCPAEVPSGNPVAHLVAVYQGAEGLFVLDGCEQVVVGVAALVAQLQAVAPNLRILVTTRRTGGVLEGVRRQLGPLPTPSADARDGTSPLTWRDEVAGSPAVQLFADRARMVRSDFALTDENRSDVLTVVGAVEGLPLGIEVAAAQVDVLSVADIAAELLSPARDLSEAELSVETADLLGSTLGVALDVSVRLLTDEERTAFCTWAVFSGSFTIDDAAAVLERDRATAKRLLISLVRQSLIEHDGASTYRMLRPVRASASSRLAQLDAWEVRRRHAEHVRSAVSVAAEELRTTTTALARLRRYEADARSALRWSLESGHLDIACDIAVDYRWHWAINGMPEEGLGWLRSVERAIREGGLHQNVSSVQHGSVLRSIGLLVNPLGDVVEGRRVCLAAIDLLEEGGDELGVVDALLTLGISEWALGDLVAATQAHDSALTRALRLGQPFRVLTASVLLARTALDARADDAQVRIADAVEMARAQGERQLLSIALGLLARSHLCVGRLGEARLAAEQAVAEARSIGYREGEMGALNLVARAAVAEGDADGASALLAPALRMAIAASHTGGKCETLESLALAAACSGAHERTYLLVRAAAQERARRGLATMGTGQPEVQAAGAAAAAVLGDAAALIDARLAMARFDDLVDEVLEGLPGSGQDNAGSHSGDLRPG